MTGNTNKVSALELIDDAIAELEARLNIQEGASVAAKEPKDKKQAPKKQAKALTPAPVDDNLPNICKIEFKVGVITKVWVHETADKLYCEEIDCGEPEPRQIASGLRPHFTSEQMQGQRLLVVANLKSKNLVGFKSHGMVLCAAATRDDGSEFVEFVEPPFDAPIGEVVSFQDLPSPQPATAAQVEKKKIFQACMEGMKTTEECQAAWNGHLFMTSRGPCTVKSIKGGVLR
jgi:aminoacyl tRNA synthase complex-interacting multifunctional protein 1